MEPSFDVTPEELKVFLDEAEEQLQRLDDCVVRLEKEPTNPELLQEIFRAFHTMKGSSATVGHKGMTRLAHATESVLDRLRTGTLTASSMVIDLLTESLDALRSLKDEFAAGKADGADIGGLAARLEAVSTGEEPPSSDQCEMATSPLKLNDAELARLEAAELRGHNAYLVEVVFAQDSPLVAARSFQMLISFSELGEIITSSPSASDIEAEKTSFNMAIILVTEETPERITRVAKRVPGVASVEVAPWAPEEEPAVATKKEPSEERGQDKGPKGPERRVIDLGLEARGKSAEEMLGLAAKKMAAASSTVRVDVHRLDNLMNLSGELVIGRNRLLQVSRRLDLGTDDNAVAELGETSRHMERVVDELQEEIMKSRMLPIESVFNKLPRMVRDLARKANKLVALRIEGQSTELDRSVTEEIGDPLIHILRNAIDHGIEPPDERVMRGKPETGTIHVSARHADYQILVEIEDDGRGIDPEAIKEAAILKGIISEDAARLISEREALELMFAPGLSTARAVTDSSGRGVGLDIVKAHISRLNGAIHVESWPGSGTRFVLKLPWTLAVIKALLVGLRGELYAVPLNSVTEVLRIERSQIRWLLDRQSIVVRGATLPLFSLDEALGLGTSVPNNGDRRMAVVVRMEEKRVGLLVDSLIGEQEVVIKSLGRYIGEIEGISGTTILGDGRVAFIVDVQALLRRAMGLRAEDEMLVEA